MHRLRRSIRPRRPGRTIRIAALGGLAALGAIAGGCTEDRDWADAAPTADVADRPAFAEPVRLSARDGVLEVTLSARQGRAVLDTVASPVDDFLLFGYSVEQGSASNGQDSARDLYPAPTLHVDPGDTLIVHLENELVDLTVSDYLDPAFTPAGGEVPIYPSQLTSSPLNLHTHGLHVTPSGNSDNVLLDIPGGMSNTYTYAVPDDMPQGLYWYHSHRHTITAQQTYLGLAGLIQVGRSDGGIPLVSENDLPVRNMALQYNYVVDRRGGQHQLNNVNRPQYVSTLEPPSGDELAKGTYEPSLTPVNFAETDPGTTFVTDWYSGPLSIDNNRGLLQFLPTDLVDFRAADDPADDLPADPDRPDHERDLQFTVNGQFQPRIAATPGQTEIWVLANISDFAYMNVTLTETATGDHPPIAVVAQDGNPYERVQRPTTGDGTTLLIPPASRYAIAVTMPAEGELVLEMPPLPGGGGVSGDGIRYTSDGTSTPPGVLGKVSAAPSAISYVDGFFAFPTQELLRMRPPDGDADAVQSTVFAEGQALDAFTSFVDTSVMEPSVRRTLQIGGGFLNKAADPNDPKAFVYAFDGNAFPSTALIQPRLNSVEEWTILNNNNDEHPIHIHVNDFQVTRLSDPVAGTDAGPQPWGQDNANTPAPSFDAAGNVSAPGVLTVRTRFEDYTGTYVIHCHRLNHEDNGLMAVVNVIPEVSTYAVADADGRVRVYDGADDSVVATVTPFADTTAPPNVAMADVDGDRVLDLIAAAGEGSAPEVAVYSGAAAPGAQPFGVETRRFRAFADDMTRGLTVAGADIDGDAVADIVVGTGPGTESRVKVFSTAGPTVAGEDPEVFSEFAPYGDSTAGVTLATGMVDDMSGRSSIVTAPGPGEPAEIRTWRFDLYTVNDAGRRAGVTEQDDHGAHLRRLGIDIDVSDPSDDAEVAARRLPMLTSSFLAFGGDDTDGVSLAVGWLAGTEGGAQRVVAGQLGDDSEVRVFATSSALENGPAMYLQSPDDHDMTLSFRQIASFVPFAGSTGVRVATTSTVDGADLVVGSGGGSGVAKYRFARSESDPTTLQAAQVATVAGPGVRAVGSLGGA